MNIDISILIPTYNEARNIEKTLSDVVSYFLNLNRAHEIIISDDGSLDETVKVVENFSREKPNIQLLKNQHLGKAATLAEAIKKSSGEYILLTDADGAAAINEFAKLYEALSNPEFDIAIGSREGKKARRIGEPFRRHFMGRVFNLLIRIVTGLKFNDTQCGFKLFRASVLKDLLGKSRIMNQKRVGLKVPMVTAFDVELLVLARLLNYGVTEVPINWRYVKTNNVNLLRDSLVMIREVLEIRANLARGIYVKSNN